MPLDEGFSRGNHFWIDGAIIYSRILTGPFGFGLRLLETVIKGGYRLFADGDRAFLVCVEFLQELRMRVSEPLHILGGCGSSGGKEVAKPRLVAEGADFPVGSPSLDSWVEVRLFLLMHIIVASVDLGCV